MENPEQEVNLDSLDFDLDKFSEATAGQVESGNAGEGAVGEAVAKPEGEPEAKPEGDTQVAPDGVEKPEGEQPEEDPIVKLVGKDAFLRVKGKDYPISELTPDQIRAYLQKGMAFEKNQSELAGQRKSFEAELQKEREKLQQELLALQQLKELRGQATGKPKAEPDIPEELVPTEYDPPEVAQLKTLNVDLIKRVKALEQVSATERYSKEEQRFLQEIDQQMEHFPLASKEEVVAVKLLYPNAPLDQLVQKSHEERANEKFVESVFKHKPELYLKFSEKAVAQYLAKKGQSGVVPLRGGAGSTPKTTQTAVDPSKVDFDLAESMVMEKLKSLDRAKAEMES